MERQKFFIEGLPNLPEGRYMTIYIPANAGPRFAVEVDLPTDLMQKPKLIQKGTIVLIPGDTYEDDRYEVLQIKGNEAEVQLISPQKSSFWIALDEIEVCNCTKQEAIIGWQKRHGYSGI